MNDNNVEKDTLTIEGSLSKLVDINDQVNILSVASDIAKSVTELARVLNTVAQFIEPSKVTVNQSAVAIYSHDNVTIKDSQIGIN